MSKPDRIPYRDVLDQDIVHVLETVIPDFTLDGLYITKDNFAIDIDKILERANIQVIYNNDPLAYPKLIKQFEENLEPNAKLVLDNNNIMHIFSNGKDISSNQLKFGKAHILTKYMQQLQKERMLNNGETIPR